MTRLARLTFACAVAAAISLGMIGSPASAQSAPIQDYLAEALAFADPGTPLTVLVHGTDLPAARAAVAAAGLRHLHELERIGVVVASGSPDGIRAAAERPDVVYVEGDRPVRFALATSGRATRGAEAIDTLTGADGRQLDGRGVSVAVIDSGVDATHPFFREPDGSSAIARNLRNACGLVPADPATCFADLGPAVDTDALSMGGHGTHVNGIVAGRPTTLIDGGKLSGAAPGAKLVSLSIGEGPTVVAADLALEWVLDNHQEPCGPGVPVEVCPPIKVTNNSYQPAGGSEFDPYDAMTKLQRALAIEGLVTVWSNGNSGGDGSANHGNPLGQDPTPGIISVASYWDLDTGTRNGRLSGFSSRGDLSRPETWPDISAPGENVTSSCRPYLPQCYTGFAYSGIAPQDGPAATDLATFHTLNGTSMAAPQVAGIVAQLFQARPTATPGQIEDALKSTAYKYVDWAPYQPLGDYTSSYDKGTGLVDVVAAVRKLTSPRGAAGDHPRRP